MNVIKNKNCIFLNDNEYIFNFIFRIGIFLRVFTKKIEFWSN